MSGNMLITTIKQKSRPVCRTAFCTKFADYLKGTTVIAEFKL